MSKVLIVDDSPTVLMAFSRQVQRAGFEVATHPAALGVLRAIVREKPEATGIA